MKNKITDKLFELAYTDSMTEVQNRNAYEERLKKLRKTISFIYFGKIFYNLQMIIKKILI